MLLTILTIASLVSCNSQSLDYLKEKTTFDSKDTLVYTIPHHHWELITVQGGYADENYYYQIFLKKDS